MIEKLIKEVFNTTSYELEPYDRGLNNHNYLLKIKDDKYIIRIPYEESNHLFDRFSEEKVMKITSSLDVDLVYFNHNNGIKITKYIDGLLDFNECQDKDKIERCAKLMKKLHNLPTIDKDFDPIKHLIIYQSNIKKPIYNLSKYDLVIEKVNEIYNPSTLCHNDFVPGNILYSTSRDYLIDYEYASNNDPLFDVMSFISENSINDKADRDKFYNSYFDHIDEYTLNKLKVWEAFHHILWCNWAMMMYEKLHDNVYKEIAKEKYEALVLMEKNSD